MQTDQALVRLSPRTPWQAMDLGTTLYRHWWRQSTLLWFCFTLPVLLVFLFFFSDYPWAVILLFWWLKPLWERILLEFYARAIFAKPLNLKQLVLRFPDYALPGLMSQLSVRRFSLSRSYNTPVYQLEKLRGEQARKRLSFLHRPPSQRSMLLTLLMLHIEQVLSVAVILLILMLVPLGFEWTSLEEWVDLDSGITLLGWYLILSITEPLYVASGFSLYLNKRSHLEGWDLETGLRKIGQQRNKIPAGNTVSTGVLMLAVFLVSFWTPDITIAQTTDHPRQQAIEILAGEDFMPMRTEQRLALDDDQWQEDELPWLDTLFDWLLPRPDQQSGLLLSDMVRLLLWLVASVFLLWLLRTLVKQLPATLNSSRNRPARKGLQIQTHRHARNTPPDLWAQQICQAIDQQDHRRALGLLYQATLNAIAQQTSLQIDDDITEQECLKLVHTHQPGLSQLLEPLIQDWTRIAWANQPIDENRINLHFQRWQQLAEGAQE